MSATDRFLENNDRHVSGGFHRRLPSRPSRSVAIVACMDSRLDIFEMLGLELGEAHVIRNAGGVATDDVLRSLLISQRMLGTKEIVLIHHTECGMETFTDDDLSATLAREIGYKPPFALHAFDDVREDVRQSMRRIGACPFIPEKDSIRGFVFDVATGKLHEVRD